MNSNPANARKAGEQPASGGGVSRLVTLALLGAMLLGVGLWCAQGLLTARVRSASRGISGDDPKAVGAKGNVEAKEPGRKEGD